jgi:hypothetical protein
MAEMFGISPAEKRSKTKPRRQPGTMRGWPDVIQMDCCVHHSVNGSILIAWSGEEASPIQGWEETSRRGPVVRKRSTG